MKDLPDDEIMIVEYRSLGGYMFNFKEYLFDQLMAAITAFNSRDKKEIEIPTVVQDAINNNNEELAAQLMNQFNITLPKQLVDEHTHILGHA